MCIKHLEESSPIEVGTAQTHSLISEHCTHSLTKQRQRQRQRQRQKQKQERPNSGLTMVHHVTGRINTLNVTVALCRSETLTRYANGSRSQEYQVSWLVISTAFSQQSFDSSGSLLPGTPSRISCSRRSSNPATRQLGSAPVPSHQITSAQYTAVVAIMYVWSYTRMQMLHKAFVYTHKCTTRHTNGGAS